MICSGFAKYNLWAWFNVNSQLFFSFVKTFISSHMCVAFLWFNESLSFQAHNLSQQIQVM